MRLAAQDTYGVVVVLQAMDAAGKDGTIRHVMSGVNPQGVQVSSFKIPSSEDLDHDYLWRYQKKLPERGNIGIFNRSYYEEVLVVRVHPQILANQKLPAAAQGPRHLEAALPRDQRLGALPDRPGLSVRQAVPQPQQGGAAPPVPGPHRRAREELEVQRQRRQGARRTGTTTRRRSATCSRNTSTDVGAVVRHPGRRQAVRPGRRGRRPRQRPDRDRPAVPEGLPTEAREALQAAKVELEGQAPEGVGAGSRSRPSWPRRAEGAKEAQEAQEGEEVMTGRQRRSSRPRAPHAGDAEPTTAWHALTPDEALAPAGRRRRRRA